MSDIRFNNAMNTGATFENEHAGAHAATSSDSALHASESGVSYDGSASIDASHSATLSDLPETPDAVGEARSMLDAAAGDATSHVDGALGAAGGLPEVPELDGAIDGAVSGGASGTLDGASLGLDAMLEGMLDVMGGVFAQLSGGLTALLGF